MSSLQPQPLKLGPLDFLQVNKLLGLDLQAGDVVFSRQAQLHATRNHPDDFDLCLRHMQQVISSPDYIGRGPNQSDGFELVREVKAENAIILVAIKLRPDKGGSYNVARLI